VREPHQSVRAVLKRWKHKYESRKLLAPPFLAAQVAAPIALLVSRGCWPVFGVSLAPRRSLAASRLFDSAHGFNFLKSSGPSAAADVSATLEPERLEDLAQHLAKWSGTILGASEEKEHDEIRLCSYITMLKSLSKNLYTGSKDLSKTSNKGFKGFRFKGMFLLKAFFLARLIHDSKKLEEVVKRSLTLVVPESVVQGVLDSLLNDFSFPSVATMSRQALRIDIAFMRFMQAWFNEHMENMVGYLMIDASEVGGRDWEIAELFLLQADELVNIGAAMDFLMLAGADDRNTPDCKAASVCLLENGLRHVFPIASKGARHANIAHTMGSVLHMMRLEHFSWDALLGTTRKIIGVTTDYGTERLAHKCKKTVGRQLVATFPYHRYDWIC